MDGPEEITFGGEPVKFNCVAVLRGALGLLSVAIVVAVAGCGEDLSEEIPTPPDMSALVGAYAAPGGTLTPEASDNLAETLSTRVAAFEGVGGLDFLAGIIGGLGGAEGDALTYDPGPDTEVRRQPAEVGGTSLEGDGFFKIHHICHGWDGAPWPDEADGRADLIAVFTDAGISPVVWGAFSQCRYLLNDGEALFQSGIRVYTGASFQGLTPDGALDLLFDLQGAVDLNGEPLLTSAETLDFRVTGAGLEIRLPVADGDIIFYSKADPSCSDECGELLGFRAGNGDFLCDATTSVCSNGDVELPFSLVGL